MLNRQERKAKVLFGLSDIVLTALAFEAAYQTRQFLPLERVFFLSTSLKGLVLGYGVLAWVLAGMWLRVYERLDAGSTRVILRETFRQCAYGSIGLVVFEFTLRLDLSRAFLALFAVYSWIFLCLFRLCAGSLIGVIRREFAKPHYIMIVGTDDRAVRLARELENSARYGIRLIGFLDPPRGDGPSTIRLDADYPVFPVNALRELVCTRVIDEILFAVKSGSLHELEDVFLLCDEEGVRTRVAVDCFPHVNSKVSLEQFGATPLLTFSAAPHDEIRMFVKRISDVILAGAALALLFPVMVLIGTLVRLTSRGPVIFKQQRCGLNGRRFTFYKFRSMCENADQLKESIRHLSRRSTATKIPNDPRLTPIGGFLRKFSIDEWPQLWNVLKGDMSLVGPRPAVPEEVDQYAQWQRRRMRMRPGLTCLWALNGRDQVDFETWMKMDLQYIDNWSLALDWKILLLTIPRVVTGQGAS